MSRAYSHEVNASYHALLDDVRGRMPDLVPYLLEDLPKLLKLVETRGPGIVCIDLPGLGKVFDKTLSSGVFDFSKVPAPLGSQKRGFIFQNLLSDFLFEPHTGQIYKDVDPDFVFLMRTYFYMHKDMIKEPHPDEIQTSVSTFIQGDQSLRTPSLSWCSDDLLDGPSRPDKLSFHDGVREWEGDLFGYRPATCRAALIRLLDRVTALSARMQGVVDPDELCGRHGPGAVADIRTGEDKYTFPNWPRKLGRTFPYEHHAQVNEWVSFQNPGSYSLHEPPARLLAVPKSMKGPRLITSEPTAHQFLQQGLLRWIRDTLPAHLRIAIDFKSQVPSRELALEASRTGSHMTVDLSSASDFLSLWTVERCFRTNPSFLTALHACRTRYVCNYVKGTNPERGHVILRKYAGQGNATTFPVQSIVYTLLAITSVMFEEHGRHARVTPKTLRHAARKVRVYGDDIIIPSSCGHNLAELLEFLQLKVNWAKTHHKGSFRESCGMDAYRGYDVTPLYMQSPTLQSKATPGELVSWIDVSNNAYTKGLWSLSNWMVEQIPQKIRADLPILRDTLACLSLVTYTRLRYFGRTRMNSSLYRSEVRGYTVQTKEVRERRNSYQSLLQYFVERPQCGLDFLRGHEPLSNWASGWVVRRRLLLKRRWVPTS